MVVFYCFSNVTLMKEILTVLLSSIKNEKCDENLDQTGGFIDLTMFTEEKVKCMLKVRITESKDELIQLVKEAKKDGNSLVNVYTYAKEDSDMGHVQGLQKIMK